MLSGCFNSLVEVLPLHSKRLNETLYLKRKSRGLNYGVLVLSKSASKYFEPDKSSEYVFTSDVVGTFFYKFERDTLSVFVRSPIPSPPDMKTKIYIQQIQLSNPEMMKLFDDYQAKGIKKF